MKVVPSSQEHRDTLFILTADNNVMSSKLCLLFSLCTIQITHPLNSGSPPFLPPESFATPPPLFQKTLLLPPKSAAQLLLHLRLLHHLLHSRKILLLRRAPAAPSPPPTSCPVFIMTDIDHNFTTSVANASHGGSSIWSVDLLFFEAGWVQAAPRLFPFYCTAYHFFFSLLGDSPKNQFFFSGWLKAVKPILWSSFCHAALHLLQSK